jgi:hypothetical protein
MWAAARRPVKLVRVYDLQMYALRSLRVNTDMWKGGEMARSFQTYICALSARLFYNHVTWNIRVCHISISQCIVLFERPAAGQEYMQRANASRSLCPVQTTNAVSPSLLVNTVRPITLEHPNAAHGRRPGMCSYQSNSNTK